MSGSSHPWFTILILCIIVLMVPDVANRGDRGPAPQPALSAEPHPGLCTLIEAGSLADLRWPDFSDYRSEVADFYGPSGCALAWSAEGRPTFQAVSLIAILQDAAQKGLRPEDYDGPLWKDRLARLPVDSERFDAALTVATLRYVSDIHQGRVNPRRNGFDLKVEARHHELAAFLRGQLVAGENPEIAIAAMEPQYLGYRRALNALERYLALEKAGDVPPLPPPGKSFKSIKPGSPWADTPLLAARLRQLGDLAPDSVLSAQADRYDGALVEAVRRFQRRHGLTADGGIGAETVKQLNIPVSQRVLQLQLTLERWRWLPHNLPFRMVVINIPQFELRGYEDHHATITMPVIVGLHFHERQTPVFQDEMEYVIFHPQWTVPVSIARKELIPAVRANPGYLDKHHMEIINSRGEALRGAMDDDMARRLRAGTLEFRQKAGPDNALGPIKFVFPNQYDVYLHGTPEKRLFARARRDFSHGCIRVEDPPALADWVLKDTPEWNAERIRMAVADDRTLQVRLHEPLTVLVVYGTAFVEEDGEIRFFEDIYGHDAALQRALAKGYPYPE